MAGTNGNGNGNARVGTSTVKQGLAQMLKGGVIVSCTTATSTLNLKAIAVWFYFMGLFSRMKFDHEDGRHER